MTDLAMFRGNRAPRRANGSTGIIFDRDRASFGSFIVSLRELVAGGVDGDYYTVAAERAQSWLYPFEGPSERVDPAALERQWHPVFDGAGGEVLWLLVNLDRFLIGVENAPAPADLADTLHRLFDRIDFTPDWPERVLLPASTDRARERLLDTLAAALLLPAEAALAQRANRLLLVLALLTTWAELAVHGNHTTVDDMLFDSPQQILALLRHRFVVLPNPPFPQVLPENRVRLVRAATVADLWVVRSEWRCYVAGELADIRNLMAQERLSHRTLRIDETEITSTVEEQNVSITDTSTETSETSEFTSATRREVDLAIHAEGQVNTSGQYGPTKVDTHFGGAVDYSLRDASERATRIARGAVSRAAAHEESRVRTERTERTLSRFESEQTHGFEPGKSAQRGVYRWVDRIDRLQMYRYPDRLQLEFQLPEPGRFLLGQLKSSPRQGRHSDPGEFTVKAADVTRDSYSDLAVKYAAGAVPAPPQQTISITAGLSTDKVELPGDTVAWNAPVASKTVEVAIPAGYAATTAVFDGHATPVHGKWRRERTQSGSFEDLEGFHTLTMSVAAGGDCVTAVNSGPVGGGNTVQDEGTADGEVQYTQAMLEIADTITLDPPVASKVPIALSAVGASSAIASVELACQLTREGELQWRQEVLDALLAGYQAQVRAYQDEQEQLGLGQAIYERSPARNAEMTREELKRQAISWLLGESPFLGRDAISPHSDDADYNIDTALTVADDIQFLEQALEWSNLVYVAYPYYWARRDQWTELEKLETADPDLARFLRSGSARVVVPARPGFDEAVQHWLMWRQPWGGGAPPVPGEALYLSVAEEIRDLTQPPPDGVPGDSWEVRLPTTLQYLDPKENLPRNDLARLGKPPHQPADPLSEPPGDDA